MNKNITIAYKTDYEALTTVWEASVRTTHHFLTEKDILFFRPKILNEYLFSVELRICKDESDQILGFIGMSDHKVEMLFVNPESQGQGIGKRLLMYAIAEMDANTLDVNEQNPEALGFYEHMGFKVVGRSPLDGMGNPFPLLHMRL